MKPWVKQEYEWLNRFKRGEMSVEGQPRCGRPSTNITDENVEKVRQAVLEDRRQAIDESSEVTGVSLSSCQRI